MARSRKLKVGDAAVGGPPDAGAGMMMRSIFRDEHAIVADAPSADAAACAIRAMRRRFANPVGCAVSSRFPLSTDLSAIGGEWIDRRLGAPFAGPAAGRTATTEADMAPIEAQLVKLRGKLAEAEKRAAAAEAVVDALRGQVAREICHDERPTRELRRTWRKRLLLG